MWDICIGIINLYYLSEDNTGLSLLIRNSMFALNIGFCPHEKQRSYFVGLRDYIRFNHPDMVEEFDKTISKMTKKEITDLGHKGSFIETINEYLVKIVNNERLFYIVQSWKYEVWRMLRLEAANMEYVPATV